MNKICTNIQQSKKLIELGIDVNTADMYYHNRIDIPDNFPLPIEWKRGNPLLSQEIPAWSLSALLGLIPKEQHLELLLNAHYKWICDIIKPFSFAYKPTAGDNPLDAAFEMICWLKENNKL